jgi:hypothetical protein
MSAVAFLALNLAHLARCVGAILSRAAAESPRPATVAIVHELSRGFALRT